MRNSHELLGMMHPRGLRGQLFDTKRPDCERWRVPRTIDNLCLLLDIWSAFFWLFTSSTMSAVRIATIVQHSWPAASAIVVDRNPQPAHFSSVVSYVKEFKEDLCMITFTSSAMCLGTVKAKL